MALASAASATTIQAGADLQAAINGAQVGDIVVVGPGLHSPFEVSKPITVLGLGMPTIKAGIQRPGITISANGAVVKGFRIEGIPEDSTSKFEHYMKSAAKGPLRLNLPNAAILVSGNGAVLEDMILTGAQVGVFVDGYTNLAIRNATFERCSQGAQILNSKGGVVELCRFLSCGKSGLDVEQSYGIVVVNNTFKGTTHAGMLLKQSSNCTIDDNVLSGNTEGIALWSSSNCQVMRNRVDHNYYGILVTGSNNNTVVDNRAEENRRSEIVRGFGTGISLQENSSYNVVARNLARDNFNGLEATRGCQFNSIHGNEARENDHGIRMDKSLNNLIYSNNFMRNTVSAYDNASHNFWNATVGNYYSDYKGADRDGDGIGDQPYEIPKGDSEAVDARPLMSPSVISALDIEGLRSEVRRYARFALEDIEDKPYRLENGAIVIESNRRTGPPKWPEPSGHGGSAF